MTTTTPTTDRLRARLAWLREEEYICHQDLLATTPYTSKHVRAHGLWTATRARIDEIERMMREED